jgi:hypothetical protein
VSAEQAPVQPRAQVFETAHYRIESRASDEETRKTADATESLHRAYLHFFDLPDRPRDAKLRLMLDRDRADFKRHNRSSPWAEAYYRPYICHAYYARGHPPVESRGRRTSAPGMDRGRVGDLLRR